MVPVYLTDDTTSSPALQQVLPVYLNDDDRLYLNDVSDDVASVLNGHGADHVLLSQATPARPEVRHWLVRLGVDVTQHVTSIVDYRAPTCGQNKQQH